MATKNQEMQRLIRLYKQETGETEVDMHQVALFGSTSGVAASKAHRPP